MAKLFAQEVPEIYDGIIEIKAVARDPGSRAKIAVISHDSAIDPVGACVGMRGSRVQAVVGELQGEKIDIIPWSQDPATFVVNALAPAEVAKVVMDEEQRRIEVVVPDDQLSLAIGRRGQNVRLASHLTGWDIDILTEAEESERRTEEFRTRTKMFIDALDVDDVIAHLLVTEGFTSLEEVAFVPIEELADIEGFEADIADELRNRAQAYLAEQNEILDQRRREIGVSDELAAIERLTPAMLVRLGEAGIKTLDDLADLASDELIEILGGRGPFRRGCQCRDHGRARPLVRGRRGGRRGGAGHGGGRMIAAEAQRELDPSLAPEEEEHGPLRRCLATRERLPKDEMLRFVVGPDRILVPDLEARLPGRGLWLTARRDIVERAVAKRLIERACEGEVRVPRDLARQVETLSRRRALRPHRPRPAGGSGGRGV